MADITRKLASIQRIIDIQPIKGADRIEVATILGWRVVIKKGDFNINDLCIFFEVDSVLPNEPWSDFLAHKDHKDLDKPRRLKTCKFRKQISQGLALPFHDCFPNVDPEVEPYLKEGDDLTKDLGVTLYVPPMNPQLAGLVKGTFPSFLIKTDTERIQNKPEIFKEFKDKEVYITVKMDGTSGTFFSREIIGLPGKEITEFGVCSRNLELKNTDGNLYWKMARKYDLEKRLGKWGAFNIGIQGEIHGPGIQKNRAGGEEVSMAVFDIFNIDQYTYLDYEDLVLTASALGLPLVPLVFKGIMEEDTIDKCIELANNTKYSNGSQAEGIIIRSCIEERNNYMDGRLAIKVISPEYVFKNEE